MTRPSALRSVSTSSVSAIHSLPETSYTASNLFEAVSSGPNSRKFLLSRLSLITSRRNDPSTNAVAIGGILAGLFMPRPQTAAEPFAWAA